MEEIIIKPDNITELDWELLQKMYPDNLEDIVKKINNNYPVQYLIGNVEFLDSIIEVNENVLIPRFETEYLVEKILKKLEKYPMKTLKIIDIGTGSGCIAISLAKKVNQEITAVDISKFALKTAKKNAENNMVKIKFKCLDILNEELIDDYDIVVSNPPYVDYNEKVDYSTRYEPQNAIFANKNGLEFYERILNIIKNEPKLIAFEIGMTQGEIIANMARNKFPNAQITIETDLTGRNRYVFIENY